MNNPFKCFLLTIGILFTGCSSLHNQEYVPSSEQSIDLTSAQVEHFITDVAPRYGLTPEEARQSLAQAKFQPSIIKKMAKPTEATHAWGDYRSLLITPKRISAGKLFMHNNQQTFARAQQQYGVPAPMIASILGIETFYGKNQGNYRVLDALATLSFGFPRRATFFQQELAEYLALEQKNNCPVTALKGSYAGAFGLPQFMPSSYRTCAVSEHPGQIPNLHDQGDAIFSIAHYFKMNGWVPGGFIAVPVKINAHTCQVLTCNQRKPLYAVSEWKKAGVQVFANVPNDLHASVVLLTMDDGKEAWMIFHNFYVITTYNTSINYAMAAFELSRALGS